MTIGDGPFSAEQLDKWDCPAPESDHVVHAEFYEYTSEGWLRRYWMLGVILPSSPHEATDGKCVQVLLEGPQHGAVQLTGHDEPKFGTFERGDQYIELSDGVKVLTRWVMRCLRPQEHEV